MGEGEGEGEGNGDLQNQPLDRNPHELEQCQLNVILRRALLLLQIVVMITVPVIQRPLPVAEEVQATNQVCRIVHGII